MSRVVTLASIRQSLEAAARELAQIAALGCELQDRLSPILMRLGDVAFEAQALDNLVQHAQGLEVFLDALARDCADDWRVAPAEAAAGLGLAAQRSRLAPGDDAKLRGAPAPSDVHGEFELF